MFNANDKKPEFRPSNLNPVMQEDICLAKVIRVQEKPSAVLISYEFAAGPNVGWATKVFRYTGTWLFRQRIDLAHGKQILNIYVDAIKQETPNRTIATLKQTEGCFVCVDVAWGQYNGRCYPRVRRILPAKKFRPTPRDMRVGTESWAKGSDDVNRAVMQAFYSACPILLADTQERLSPMVEYCANHNICIIPVSGMPGDYMRPNGKIVVDRKDSLAELYHNFSNSRACLSYAVAAQLAEAQDKSLVFITAVDPEDQVQGLRDLIRWDGTLPDGTIIHGETMMRQIHQYMFPFHHVRFMFVPREKQCEVIWKTVQLDQIA